MNKYLLGAIGLGLLVAGVLIGVAVKSNTVGGVRYDKAYMYDADVAGTATIKNLTLTGTATGLSTSSLTTLTVSGTSTQGIVNAGALTATTFAPSGIATMATTSATKLCLKTGAYYTVLTPSTTAASVSYSTSTTCL